MKDQLPQDVGARLRLAMQDMDIQTGSALAERLGEQSSRVRNWLNGTSMVPIPMALKLCAMMNITLDWLYKGDSSGLTCAKANNLDLIRTGAGSRAISAVPTVTRTAQRTKKA